VQAVLLAVFVAGALWTFVGLPARQRRRERLAAAVEAVPR
jgi:hypothetical protein